MLSSDYSMTKPHRNLAVVLKPWRAARCWGIWPTSFFGNLYSKVSINNLQTAVWPEAAAKWNGVHSWLFLGQYRFQIAIFCSHMEWCFTIVISWIFFPQDFPSCTGSHEICQTAQQNEVGRGTHICSNQKQPDFHQKSSLTPMSQLSPVCSDK